MRLPSWPIGAPFPGHETSSANSTAHSGCWDWLKAACRTVGSVTPRIAVLVACFSAYAALVTLFMKMLALTLGGALVPLEIGGAVISILLVFRITAGNDRWWEARTLWGGIVNQSRNLVIAALAYTSADAGWARAMVGWVSAFGVASKHLLRGEQAKLDDIQYFMSQEQARELQAAQHGPNYCAAQIAVLLHSALRSGQLPGFAFLHLEQERSKLVDYVGGCERILKTPVADVFEINLRRIVLAFLLLLPFGTTAAAGWFTPLVQLLVAYFYLSLDQIGREFQNPFGKNQLSYLPLDAICTGIQANLQALLAAEATKKQNGGGGEPCPRCFVSADAVDGSNPAGRLPQVPQSSDPSSPSSVHHVVRVAASDDGQCVCSGRAPQEEFFTSRPCLQKRPSR